MTESPPPPTSPTARAAGPRHATSPASRVRDPPAVRLGTGPVPSAGLPAGYSAPVGQIRGTGVCILLAIVTLGIYSLVWYYKVHSEMKRHSGRASTA